MGRVRRAVGRGILWLAPALMVGSSVSADQIAQSVSFDFPGPPQTYSVSQFDPTLGILTGVQVEVVNSSGGGPYPYAGNVGVFDITRPGAVTSTISVGADLGVSGPGFSFSDDADFSEQIAFSQPDARAYVTNTAPLSSGTYAIGQADLNSYVGTGTTPFDFVFTPYVGADDPRVSSDLVSPGTWSGSVEVTYTYTPPVGVPEPSATALLGMAVAWGTLGGWRRRYPAQ